MNKEQMYEMYCISDPMLEMVECKYIFTQVKVHKYCTFHLTTICPTTLVSGCLFKFGNVDFFFLIKLRI